VDIRESKDRALKSLSEALSFYISELMVQEQRAVPETVKKSLSQAESDEKNPIQKTAPEKVSSQRPVRELARKPDNPNPEPAPRTNVFGWLTRGVKGDPKRLISQLADPTKRDRAAQDLILMGGDAVPYLIEALQTKDLSLLPYYQQILARIPSATPLLIKTLGTAHPIIRGRVAEVL
jgi:hypothetical protein